MSGPGEIRRSDKLNEIRPSSGHVQGPSDNNPHVPVGGGPSPKVGDPTSREEIIKAAKKEAESNLDDARTKWKAGAILFGLLTFGALLATVLLLTGVAKSGAKDAGGNALQGDALKDATESATKFWGGATGVCAAATIFCAIKAKLKSGDLEKIYKEDPTLRPPERDTTNKPAVIEGVFAAARVVGGFI